MSLFYVGYVLPVAILWAALIVQYRVESPDTKIWAYSVLSIVALIPMLNVGLVCIGLMVVCVAAVAEVFE